MNYLNGTSNTDYVTAHYQAQFTAFKELYSAASNVLSAITKVFFK